MRTYAWGDPDDFARPKVQTWHRARRSDADVDKLAAYVERNDRGSRNRAVEVRDLRRDT